MLEKYYEPILSHFIQRGGEIHLNPDQVEISNIPSSVIVSTIHELHNLKYIEIGKGHMYIKPEGEAYLHLHSKGELPKDSVGINIGQIGHNITNSQITQSDLSTDALINSITPPSITHPKQTNKNIGKLILNWTISNIWTIILFVFIGIAIWYFTIYNPILQHK